MIMKKLLLILAMLSLGNSATIFGCWGDGQACWPFTSECCNGCKNFRCGGGDQQSPVSTKKSAAIPVSKRVSAKK